MKDDPAVSITNVDELYAHYIEWVKFLKAKGQEHEAQLAKLEASKKKKANGKENVASSISFPKTPSPIPPNPVNTGGENPSSKTIDWLDDGHDIPICSESFASQTSSQAEEPLKAEEKAAEEILTAEEADQSEFIDGLIADEDKDLDWLREI